MEPPAGTNPQAGNTESILPGDTELHQIVQAGPVGWKSFIVLPNALAWAGVITWSFLALVKNNLSGSKELKAAQK